MDDQIFVRIASYRDAECGKTIRDLFEKALVPERLRVGVCLQYAPGRDSPNLEMGRWAGQVEILRIRASKSRGVCWARAQAEALWKGEEYSLQIDSHSRFAPGFDEKLVEQLAECPGERALLSSSPGAYDEQERLELDPLPSLRVIDRFDARGSLRLQGVRPGERWTAPRLSRFVAGGFVFSSSRLLEEVPYDPELYFDQEEAAYSVRLFCAGWDPYAPGETTVFHRYASLSTSRPLHWRDHPDWESLRGRGQARFDALVGRRTDLRLGRYALREVRALAAFESETGVNFLTSRVSRPAETPASSNAAERTDEVSSVRDAGPDASSLGDLLPLEPGDAVPFASFVDAQGRPQSIQKLGGSWTRLAIPPRGTNVAGGTDVEGSLDGLPPDPSLVVVDSRGTRLSFGGTVSVWTDRAGSFASLLGSELEWTLVEVTPRLRIQRIVRGPSLLALLRRTARSANLLTRRERTVVAEPHAPVLHVPHVLDQEERHQLMEMFELGETFPGRVGPGGGRYDPSQKVREDSILNAALCRFVDQRLGRRVFPEIEKAFGLAVVYREPYKLAAYDARQRGFFQAHRDNLDPELRYRRFALSVNLNDDFVGGEVAFPEYERATFRVPAGDALVFSCSLLHEARPVLRGTRRILLGFVAGASAREFLASVGKEERFRISGAVLRLGLSAE